MKDNLSIIITMVVLVLLMIIFPLYNNFERQDDMSYNVILKSTTLFVDEVLEAGYLDQKMYDEFVDKIANTGNIYDIELEAHKRYFTDNPSNKNEKIEQYIIDYNNDIFSSEGIASNSTDVALKNDVYYFNEGDKFYVRVKNRNTTMAEAIFSTIVPSSKKGRINANYGGIIKNVAWKPVESTHQNILNKDLEPKLYFANTGINGALGIGNTEMLNAKGQISMPVSIAAKRTPSLTFRAEGPLKADLDWWQNLDKYIWSFEDSNGNVLKGSTQDMTETFTIDKNLLKVGSYKLKIMGTSSKMGYTTAQVILYVKIDPMPMPKIEFISPLDVLENGIISLYTDDYYEEPLVFNSNFKVNNDWRDNVDNIYWNMNNGSLKNTVNYTLPTTTLYYQTNTVKMYGNIEAVGYNTAADTRIINRKDIVQTIKIKCETVKEFWSKSMRVDINAFNSDGRYVFRKSVHLREKTNEVPLDISELESEGIVKVELYFRCNSFSNYRDSKIIYSILVSDTKGKYNTQQIKEDNGVWYEDHSQPGFINAWKEFNNYGHYSYTIEKGADKKWRVK